MLITRLLAKLPRCEDVLYHLSASGFLGLMQDAYLGEPTVYLLKT
jgi:hypothetical protein